MAKTADNTYDLAVIGGGTAGLAAAKLAARAGRKTCLIEKAHIGGRQFFFGDVPLRRFAQTSLMLHQAQQLNNQGLVFFHAPLQLEKIHNAIRTHQVEMTKGPFDEKKLADQSIDFIQGEARFSSKNTLAVNGQTIKAKNIIIATGSLPGVPDIDGLEELGYLTPHSFWDTRELPFSLTILGTDPDGLRLAQSLSYLGCHVTLVGLTPKFLPDLGPWAAGQAQAILEKSGVRIVLNFSPEKANIAGKVKSIIGKIGDQSRAVASDEILVAFVRVPDIENLGLETIQLPFNEKGIMVNEQSRTRVPNIFTIGSANAYYPFQDRTMLQAQAAIGAQLPNSMLSKTKIDESRIPHILALDPPVVRLGWPDGEKPAQKTDIAFYEWELENQYRALFSIEKPKGQLRGISMAGPGAIFALPFWQHAIINRVELSILLQEFFPATASPVAYRKTEAKKDETKNKGTLDENSISISEFIPIQSPGGIAFVQPGTITAPPEETKSTAPPVPPLTARPAANQPRNEIPAPVNDRNSSLQPGKNTPPPFQPAPNSIPRINRSVFPPENQAIGQNNSDSPIDYSSEYPKSKPLRPGERNPQTEEVLAKLRDLLKTNRASTQNEGDESITQNTSSPDSALANSNSATGPNSRKPTPPSRPTENENDNDEILQALQDNPLADDSTPPESSNEKMEDMVDPDMVKLNLIETIEKNEKDSLAKKKPNTK